MKIRAIEDGDFDAWIRLRIRLWPDQSPANLRTEGRAALDEAQHTNVFVAEENGNLIGFLELRLRSYAEGCDSSPVPYVEGWYVDEPYRLHGIGRALMKTAEDWSRRHGYKEMSSDTEVTNQLSRKAHAAIGFEEVESLVIFRKAL